MTGIRKLRKIQLGQETTAGTQVSASTIWRGMGTIEDDLELVFADEDVGYKIGVDRTYIPKKAALLELEETPATFEQIVHILQMGIEEVSSAVDGSGSGHIYTFPFATTTDTASVQTYTIEGGDNQQEEEFAYGFCTEFGLSGAAGEAVMMTATLVGREVSTSSYSSSATLPTVEEILFQKGKLYIDAASGTIGTTQVTQTWREFDMGATTGWQAVYTGDGNLYFSFNKNIGAEISVDFTFEHNATAVTEIAAWKAQTARLIRMKFEGSTFATAGTTYTYKTLIVDLPGKWENFDAIDEADGNDIVTGTFRSMYDPTDGSGPSIILVNTLASPS